MKKKIAIPAVATILMLVLLSTGPVFAMNKGRYWYNTYGTTTLIDPGTCWISGKDNKMTHCRHMVIKRPYTGAIGKGNITNDVNYNLNTETMHSECWGTFLIDIYEDGDPEKEWLGSLAGTWTNSQKPGEAYASGKFTGTHGTGELEGVKIMGTFALRAGEGVIIYPEGVIIYPEP